jgi:hypothetical protein
MRVCLVVSAMFVSLLSASSARAQSRVSVEFDGMVSAYDIDTAGGGSTGVARSALSSRAINSGSTTPTLGNGIAAAEIRPSILTDAGFLFAVGFRAGKAGFGNAATTLVGGDLSMGFQHRFGRFIPFVKGMVGVNSYDDYLNNFAHHDDFRIDAVIGSRLYVTERMFVSAAGFAGYGDRYGATIGVGGDVIQYFRRGVMP